MALMEELEFTAGIVREAGEIVMAVYAEDFEVIRKHGGEPVTKADQAASEHLVRRIRERYPDDAVLSEEDEPDDRRFSVDRVWAIDPLDGTKEFIKRNGEFAIMVGLSVKGRPQMGAVYRPDGDKLFLGAIGAGAWIEDGGGERQPLGVSAESDASKLRLAVSRSHRPEVVDKISTELGITEEMRSGSVGLKIGLIATQAADIYLHPSRGTKDWDTCAPEAIVHAAGGKITDIFGEALRYNEPEVENLTGIIASNGPLHDRLVEVAAPLCEKLRG